MLCSEMMTCYVSLFKLSSHVVLKKENDCEYNLNIEEVLIVLFIDYSMLISCVIFIMWYLSLLLFDDTISLMSFMPPSRGSSLFNNHIYTTHQFLH